MAINHEAQKHIEAVNKSIEFRGKLLHNVTFVEMALNAYISHFFCGNNNDKMNDMIILILGDERMSLNSKAQVFHYISTNYDETWYNDYVSIRTPPSKKAKPYTMNHDLIYMIEERNVFAHRIFDFGIFADEKLPDNTIRFTRFKNEVEPLDYTQEKFDELITTTINLKKHFEEKIKVYGTHRLSV